MEQTWQYMKDQARRRTVQKQSANRPACRGYCNAPNPARAPRFGPLEPDRPNRTGKTHRNPYLVANAASVSAVTGTTPASPITRGCSSSATSPLQPV